MVSQFNLEIRVRIMYYMYDFIKRITWVLKTSNIIVEKIKKKKEEKNQPKQGA